jgi:toxin ParE1/3/4
MKSHFLADAEEEFLEAARYYETEAAGVGIAFIVEVHKAVAFIATQPFAAKVVRNGIRKMVLRRYPYSLYYSVESDTIIIIAVGHDKRRPLYWQKRMRRPNRQG